MGELISSTHNKVLERIFRIQLDPSARFDLATGPDRATWVLAVSLTCCGVLKDCECDGKASSSSRRLCFFGAAGFPPKADPPLAGGRSGGRRTGAEGAGAADPHKTALDWLVAQKLVDAKVNGVVQTNIIAVVTPRKR